MSLSSSNESSLQVDIRSRIKQILGKKTFRGKTYYKVKRIDNDTPYWESEKNCDCPDLIDQYESNSLFSSEIDDEEEEWEVERILDSRKKGNGETEYLVKWKGWPGEPTWESAENCKCINLIAAYENPKLRRMWDFDGSNQNLWLDRRSMLRDMRRYINENQFPVRLLRFQSGFPELEQPFDLSEGLNIGPLCYENHWYLVIILVNHICTTRKMLVGDSLNTLIGTNMKNHPVLKRLRKVYHRFPISPMSMSQMDRSDVCAYYILAAFRRAIFLFSSNARYIADSIFPDNISAEILRSHLRPDTDGEISVALPVPEGFNFMYKCEFCKDHFDSRKMVDNHIKKEHFKQRLNQSSR